MLLMTRASKIHRGRGANGGDIVSLDVVNDVADSVQSFLDGIVDFMMHGSDKAGHFAGFYQVGRTFQTDGKGMELRPPGIFFMSVSTRLPAYFLAMAEMTELSRPPERSTP